MRSSITNNISRRDRVRHRTRLVSATVSLLAFALACFIVRTRMTGPNSIHTPGPVTVAPSHNPRHPAPRCVKELCESDVFAQVPIPAWEKRLQDLTLEIDSDVLEEICGTVADADLRMTLDQLASGRYGPAGLVLAQSLISRWATIDPSAAAEWVSQLPGGAFGEMACREIAVALAKVDMDGAVKFVEKLQEDGNQTTARLSLAAEAATQTNSRIALILLTDIPAGPERDEVMDYSIQQWAVTDFGAAFAWLAGVPDPVLRDKILNNLVVDLAVENPFDAAEFAAARTLPGQISDRTLADIVRFCATSQPERTAAWLEKFPEGALRDQVFQELIDVWARDDASQAATWLSQLSESHSRELALERYVFFTTGARMR
jgi:hypothetical protein